MIRAFICFKVELEGIEPSSKRGNHKISARCQIQSTP